MENDVLARTPLYDEHVRLNARMVPFGGWTMPVQYSGLSEEHRAVRTAAGLFDVSHMGELEMRGEWALSVLNYLVTGDVGRLTDGQALYTCACNEGGTILDDLIVYRLGSEHFMIVCNASNREKIVAHFERAALHHCEFEDRSSQMALLALQGPRALDVLALAGKDAAECRKLASFTFRDSVVANVHTTVARTGYTGEDGVEIFCSPGEAPALFRTLLDLGRPFGLLPAGLGARDTLRLEARLSLYGNEIDETTHPFEAGLGRLVAFDKGDFVGREALAMVRDQGLSRKLVGFEMIGRGVARHGYPLLDSTGMKVGVCTSGSPSPTLGKAIGLGYLPMTMTAPSTPFAVDCRGKPVDAVVVKTPFYHRGKST